MGMITVDFANELIEEAKTKNSGVYSHKGVQYVVKNGNFVAYADHLGYIYQRFGSFFTLIGECSRYDIRRVLNQWLKDN